MPASPLSPRCARPLPRRALLAMVAIAALSHPHQASPQTPNDTPEKLAHAYILAVQAHDTARVLALYHPRLLACRSDANAPYFDYLMQQELINVPPPGYKITFSPQYTFPLFGLPEDKFPIPAAPTTQFQIDWSTSDSAITSVIRLLAPEAGRWYLVYPCPNAAGMEFFRNQMGQGTQQKQQAAALAAAIPPPLRAELLDLLSHGQKIDAIHKYQAATGADLTTAVQVINTLQTPTPPPAK